MRNAPRIIGKSYKPACGKCEALPWEVCECSFQQPGATADNVNAESMERLAILQPDLDF